MEQETTRESESKAVMSSDPTRQQEIEDLNRKVEAQNQRIKFLESFLTKKLEKTKIDYERLRVYFEGQKNWIMQIFFSDFPCRLSAEDVTDRFIARHQGVNVSNLSRRLYELCEDGRLCRSYDEAKGKVVFYLNLFPDDKVNGENDKRSDGHKESCGENESK